MSDCYSIVVMGVSGCGKSTIGKRLAESLNGVFLDGDDFHPPANVKKMTAGIPLDDHDRQPWLERLQTELTSFRLKGVTCVIACSALKQSYRNILSGGGNEVDFLYLKGSFDQIFTRVNARKGHFMPPELLQSQFDALEEPNQAITVSIMDSPAQIIEQTLNRLHQHDNG